MRIVITAATSLEFTALENALAKQPAKQHITFTATGVGMLATTYSLIQIAATRPNLIIQMGIAGCFNQSYPLATVLAVQQEYLGDTGVEEDNTFKDIFDLQLAQPNEFPFKNKALTNPWLAKYLNMDLARVAAVTVNEVTTNIQRINVLQKKYNPVIESMEGAALHYVCLRNDIPFLQLRALSNYVGERDKNKWQIKTALDNLRATMLELLHTMPDHN